VTDLYRYIPIWCRVSGEVVLYRVFEVIGRGYTVQSKDFYRQASNYQSVASLETQFLELLQEQAPDERFRISPTIEAAVAAFDEYFEESEGA